MLLTLRTALRLLEVNLANFADFWSCVRDCSLITSSNLVCWQGKEKVNPTGSFLSLMLCFSMKSPRHSATWSNSWSRRGEREAVMRISQEVTEAFRWKTHPRHFNNQPTLVPLPWMMSSGVSYTWLSICTVCFFSWLTRTWRILKLLPPRSRAMKSPFSTEKKVTFFQQLLNYYYCNGITYKSCLHSDYSSLWANTQWCTAALGSVPALIICYLSPLHWIY